MTRNNANAPGNRHEENDYTTDSGDLDKMLENFIEEHTNPLPEEANRILSEYSPQEAQRKLKEAKDKLKHDLLNMAKAELAEEEIEKDTMSYRR